METASYDSDEGQILFGDFLRSRVDAAAVKLPATSFMGEWPAPMPTDQLVIYYGRSWLLVHYLIDEHLKEFGKFLVRVSAGDDWKTAWAGEISLPLDDVDDALNRYYYRAKYGLWTVVARHPDSGEFAQSTAPPADIYALRSLLQAAASNPDREATKTEAAQRDLGAAASLDPHNARVQRIRAAVADAAR
jgi:hypothetical protein